MNDFTKEELLTIKKAIDGLLFSKFYAEDIHMVYKKIQSMIDNYCEHAWENPCCGCAELHCEKCHRFFNEKQ